MMMVVVIFLATALQFYPFWSAMPAFLSLSDMSWVGLTVPLFIFRVGKKP